MIKTGIFGGAFDPPHVGHVNLALWVAKTLFLNKTLIIPTGEPPHKSASSVSFADRFEMAKLAFNYPKIFEVSDIENNSRKNYTIDTIRELKAQSPRDTEFFLIIGGDMLASFGEWREYKQILRECKVVAAAREHNRDELREYSERFGIMLIKAPVIPVSSTEIRAALAAGERGYGISSLPEKVYDYIKNKGLYR
ncbi:MAG: nicotinate (nicotinamide) nucleotide adenylyltransferase [Oscillospiraceae bacterium]|nr:nicotinate (nicotinamide) nucleotide adenylyltransferase [Oscillospiraceae bacterium]